MGTTAPYSKRRGPWRGSFATISLLLVGLLLWPAQSQPQTPPQDKNNTDKIEPVHTSITVVENVDPVESWSRYEVAPDDAFHVIVGFVAAPVVPFAGDARTGAAGMPGADGVVVKLETLDHALVPPEFVAFTRQ